MVVVGGVIPPQDYDALLAAGAAAVFRPGTVIPEAAADLLVRSTPGSATRPERGGRRRQLRARSRRLMDVCPVSTGTRRR